MKLESLLVATIGLWGLISCEKSESLTVILPEDGVIRVSAEVDATATRAGALTGNLTEFGMFVKAPNAPYSYNNVKASEADGVWTTSKDMLWNNATDEVEMIAYAPYNTSFGDLTTVRTISVLADQSTDDNIVASDFLYAKSSVCPNAPTVNNPIHYNTDKKKVEVKLNHHFSKLMLTITINGEFHGVPNVGTTNPISNLVIKGTNTSTTIALKDGDIAAPTNPLSITPFAGTYEGLNGASKTGRAEYEAIVIPQNVTTLSIEFTIGGKEYVWTAEALVVFSSGGSHTLALTVGRSSVEEASYKVGDVFPKGAVGDAIVGVVWMVKGADGNADLTAGATGSSGSILALRDIEEDGIPKLMKWGTTTNLAWKTDLHMRTNFSGTYLSDGKACQAYVLDYIDNGIEAENGYSQAVPNTKNYTLANFPAFKVCVEYTDGDALDIWYLPAQEQLRKKSDGLNQDESGIYFELTRSPSPLAEAIGGIGTNAGGAVIGVQSFLSKSYWSSTEYHSNHSWYVNFNLGNVNTNNKNNDYYVRCVRDF